MRTKAMVLVLSAILVLGCTACKADVAQNTQEVETIMSETIVERSDLAKIDMAKWRYEASDDVY